MASNRFSWRVAVALAALGLVAVAVVAASAWARGGHAQATTLVDGTTDSVTNIDPANDYDYGTFTLDLLIFQGLYGYPHGSKLEPVLATRLRAEGEHDHLVLHAAAERQVHRRHADDLGRREVVVRPGDQDQGRPGHLRAALQPEEHDARTGTYGVTFHLKSPQSTWPFILATNAGYIVPKALYPADKIRDNSQSQVGTGPYQLVKYTPGQQAVFKANPNYWGPKPKNDNLIINYYSKSSTMKLALQRGEIDMAFRDFTPTELISLGKATGSRCTRERRRDPLHRLQPDAGADEQHRRPQGDRLPDAAADDRDPRLPRLRQAAVLDGAGRPPRSHRRVRHDVRPDAERGEGAGGAQGAPA